MKKTFARLQAAQVADYQNLFNRVTLDLGPVRSGEPTDQRLALRKAGQPDPALEAALRASDAAGLPAINVSPPQGKFLQLLARIHRARSILEIGILGGYSTIWLARALPPGGRLITLEIDPKHALVARENLARAGFANIASVRVGRALDSLDELYREAAGPFDFVFIDADKPSNPDYFAWAQDVAARHQAASVGVEAFETLIQHEESVRGPVHQGNQPILFFQCAPCRAGAISLGEEASPPRSRAPTPPGAP